MTRRLLAAALAAAALGVTAVPAGAADCVGEYRADLSSNPYRPLPTTGGGEPPAPPLPGQPREWALWYVNATTALAKCLAP